MNYSGLTDKEVIESRAQHGSNILTPVEKESRWKAFLQTLTGPLGHFIPGWENGDSLVFILEIAAIVSAFTSCAEYWGWIGLEATHASSVFFEPVGIIIAIILATGISFYFETKADNEFALLNQVNDEEPVQVIRNGMVTSVPKSDIVVGDIVMLNTGCEIPADAELLESVSMSVDESSLTGEPLTTKAPLQLPRGGESKPSDEAFPKNHVMRGTKVMEGHGICRVFAVGDATENGKVFVAAQVGNDVKTPLDEQFDRLGKAISAASFIVGILVFVGSVVTYGMAEGHDFTSPEFIAHSLRALMVAVTLVVCAVPEGLPMAVSLSLALSMRRMLKTNNLVRKLHACETMGATTVICTDKTGTLTQNQMRVGAPLQLPRGGENNLAEVIAKVFPEETSAQGVWNEVVAESFAVNSTAMLDMSNSERPSVLGNPTEGALILWLNANGYDYQSLRESADIVAQEPFTTETKMMWTQVRKGEYLIKYIKGAPEYVCPSYIEKAAEYQSKGMRTLGFAIEIEAVGTTSSPRGGQEGASERIELGVVAISDPVREDVPAAVREVMEAGIRVIMVTGDSEKTAKEIGRQIGIPAEDVIFRARPMDKRNLVERLQSEGHVVAVTGDGTNDAPALKAAHVGLSMGDGTSVAKEASDITIIDNSFSSIGRAVMWGRSLYANIQRFILFQLTVNVAACLVVLVGSFMETEPPLTVTQMLWINLIMDTFAAMALASLPPSDSVMKKKPRNRNEFIITRSMALSIILTGGFFTAVLIWMLHSFGTAPSRYQLSLVFNTFIMFQFWNLFNARAFATGQSAFHLKGCEGFLGIVAAIIVGQGIIMTIAGDLFNVEAISLKHWAMIIAGTSSVLLIGEIVRSLHFRTNDAR